MMFTIARVIENLGSQRIRGRRIVNRGVLTNRVTLCRAKNIFSDILHAFLFHVFIGVKRKKRKKCANLHNDVFSLVSFERKERNDPKAREKSRMKFPGDQCQLERRITVHPDFRRLALLVSANLT